MSAQDSFDRRLSAWLEDEMSGRAPDRLVAEVLAQAARVSRRPAWRIPERWIPMRIAFALAVIPRAVILVTTLVVLALLATVLVVAAQPSPAPHPPGPGRFEVGPELLQPRGRHGAIPLVDGRVLVFGGGVAAAEVADPTTGEFRAAGTMAEPRSGNDGALEAVVLADGRVLVAGGYADDGSGDVPALASAEIWDPATETWASAGTMAVPRAGHTMTLLGDGHQVLVVGGEHRAQGGGELVPTAENWDPETGFRPGGTLLHGRSAHTATLLKDGSVLVVGGSEQFEGPWVAMAERWDPESETFSDASALGTPRRFHAAVRLPDGRVLIVGGGDKDFWAVHETEIWDPVTNGFAPSGLLTGARQMELTATLLPDGRVLVMGGFSIQPGGNDETIELWDPGTGEFTAGTDPSTPLAGHVATLLQDGRVLLSGGFHTEPPGSETYVPNPSQFWIPGSAT